MDRFDQPFVFLDVRFNVVVSAAGTIEDFFPTACTMKAPTMPEMAKVFAAHGMQVVGPPLQVQARGFPFRRAQVEICIALKQERREVAPIRAHNEVAPKAKGSEGRA